MVTHIDGRMYGDGEWIVEFRNVDAFLAPMQADVITPDGIVHTVKFGLGDDKPSVALASSAIHAVQRELDKATPV